MALHALSKAVTSGAQGESGPATPAGHDHASCLMCQVGVLALPTVDANDVLSLHTPFRRVALATRADNVARVRFNPGAPVRAPPSLV